MGRGARLRLAGWITFLGALLAYLGLPHHLREFELMTFYPRFSVLAVSLGLLVIPASLRRLDGPVRPLLLAPALVLGGLYGVELVKRYRAYADEVADFLAVMENAPPGGRALGLVYDRQSRVDARGVRPGGIAQPVPGAPAGAAQHGPGFYYCGMRHMPCARSGGTAVPDPGPWAAGALPAGGGRRVLRPLLRQAAAPRGRSSARRSAPGAGSAARDPGCTTELERRAARRPNRPAPNRSSPTWAVGSRPRTPAHPPLQPKPPSRYRHLDRLCIDVHVHRAPNHLVPGCARADADRGGACATVVTDRRVAPAPLRPRTPASTVRCSTFSPRGVWVMPARQLADEASPDRHVPGLPGQGQCKLRRVPVAFSRRGQQRGRKPIAQPEVDGRGPDRQGSQPLVDRVPHRLGSEHRRICTLGRGPALSAGGSGPARTARPAHPRPERRAPASRPRRPPPPAGRSAIRRAAALPGRPAAPARAPAPPAGARRTCRAACQSSGAAATRDHQTRGHQ